MEIQRELKKLIEKYSREIVIYLLFHYGSLIETKWIFTKDKNLYFKVMECFDELRNLFANLDVSYNNGQLDKFAGELLSNTEKLEIIRNAKENFRDFQSLGMCITFREAITKFLKQKTDMIIFTYFYIEQIIPEFCQNNPKLNASSLSNAFWWNTDNRTSRINAYDYLISVYENKISEEIK